MEVKKERYKRIRGAILKLLAYEHPGSIDFKVLHFLLDDLRYTITEEECLSHVHYLFDKGLVKKDTRKTSGVELIMVSITSRGLDLIDDFIEEPGVDVRF
jgi:hypothetical protein